MPRAYTEMDRRILDYILKKEGSMETAFYEEVDKYLSDQTGNRRHLGELIDGIREMIDD